jgi:hypothetical protein
MQKWEYLVIKGFGFSNLSLTGGPFASYPKAYHLTKNGFELVNDFRNRPKDLSEVDAVGHYIAGLGEEGWELTGAGHTQESMHYLYFKRQKE